MEEQEKNELEAAEAEAADSADDEIPTDAGMDAEAEEESGEEETVGAEEIGARTADADDVDAEARGDHSGGSSSYTALTVVGEEVQIVDKGYCGQVAVLITDNGALYVAPSDHDSGLEPYDPETHGGAAPDELERASADDDGENGATEEPIG